MKNEYNFTFKKKKYTLRFKKSKDNYRYDYQLYLGKDKIKCKTESSTRIVLIPKDLDFVIKINDFYSEVIDGSIKIDDLSNQNLIEFKKYKKINLKDKRYFAKPLKYIKEHEFDILIQKKITEFDKYKNEKCYEFMFNKMQKLTTKYQLHDIHDQNYIVTIKGFKIIDYAI